jgi:hypothetical protein
MREKLYHEELGRNSRKWNKWEYQEERGQIEGTARIGTRWSIRRNEAK